VLKSALYDALSRDEAIQARLVDALIHHEDIQGIQALYKELSDRIRADYETIAAGS
jgi:hypothetical protein